MAMPTEAEPPAGSARQPLGILACSGLLPLEVAAAAHGSGRPVHIIGIEGFASDAIAQYPHTWVNLGQVGRMIGGFRQAGCAEMVIAGGMRRPNLWQLKVDGGFFRSIGTVLKMTRGGDDSVLRHIVRFFERQGFRVRGVHEVAPHLLARVGVLGSVQPSPEQSAAIARGAALIRALGEFDVGQAAVVTADRIVAVEGVRGTDAMLKAVSQATAPGNAERARVLVKLPKPGQELRVDMPVIGPETIEHAVHAGLGGIAIGGGQSLVLNGEEMARRARANGVFVVGLAPGGDGRADRAAAAPTMADAAPLHVLSRRAPTPAERRDIALGRHLLQVLATHQAGDAAVIAGQHVLAVKADLPLRALLDGAGSGAHWGRRALRKRIGILVVASAQVLIEAAKGSGEDELIALDWAAAAGLAGIACFSGAFAKDVERAAVERANDGSLFLMTSELAT